MTAPPAASPFDAGSTADEVLGAIDLTGQHVLVTGVSAGLGVETARVLVARGATVIGTARDLAKARAATAGIAAPAAGAGSLRLVECDLASLASVRACAERLVQAGTPLDLVIANAGVMACPQGTTRDGFETQLGTNHLGHFVLVNRLVPLLRRGSRVVVLASAGHRNADVDLDDPGFLATPYDPYVVYGRSKTANILFAVEFDRRHKAAGIRAVAVHPGGIRTELSRHLTPQVLEDYGARLTRGIAPIAMKSVAQGAATTVWAGVVADAETVGGRYCEDCGVAAIAAVDPGVRKGVRPYAVDPARAKALWHTSEQLVGERFPARD